MNSVACTYSSPSAKCPITCCDGNYANRSLINNKRMLKSEFGWLNARRAVLNVLFDFMARYDLPLNFISPNIVENYRNILIFGWYPIDFPILFRVWRWRDMEIVPSRKPQASGRVEAKRRGGSRATPMNIAHRSIMQVGISCFQCYPGYQMQISG